MEYEKKYNEALERARQKRDEYLRLYNDNVVPNNIEYIFPELKESKDERIRDELLDYLKRFIPHHDMDLVTKSKEWISWLEKQDSNLVSEAYERGYTEGMIAKNKEWLENHCEQKPVRWKPLPESMEALLLAIKGKWKEILPTGYMSRRLEDLYDGLVNNFDVDEQFLANIPKQTPAELAKFVK